MIFDMTRRSSGGGGGPSASDAILTVTVPTGSTVTATKGGVTLTPTLWVTAADATLDCALFVVTPAQFDSVNPWTVTATLGSDTASNTVIISSNEQYDLSLWYHVPTDLYQEVEYIQNTGQSWIDYEISPAINFRAVLKVCSDTISMSQGMLGINNSSGGASGWRVNVFYRDGKYAYFAAADSDGENIIDTAIDYGTLVDLEYAQSQGSQSLTVNGYSKSSSKGNVSAKNMCSTFRYHGASINYGIGKLQHAELYNDGVLVRDMWSCYRISDSVAGMWDKVSERFFVNAGSGTFAVGPDV